jgi:hypothetical protein
LHRQKAEQAPVPRMSSPNRGSAAAEGAAEGRRPCLPEVVGAEAEEVRRRPTAGAMEEAEAVRSTTVVEVEEARETWEAEAAVVRSTTGAAEGAAHWKMVAVAAAVVLCL